MAWTEFDALMFIWRAIVFVFVTAVLIVASVVTRNNVLHKDDYSGDNQKIRLRWVISVVLYLVGAVVGGLAIYELISGNPNSWLVFKVGMYIIVWINTVLILLRDINDGVYRYVTRGPFLAVTSILFLVIFGTSAVIFSSSVQQTKQETLQVAESKTLVAVNDSFQEKGRAGSIIFFTAFTISENGVYKYYWQDEDGGIKSGSVESNCTTIYWTKGDERPHLDKMEYKICTTSTRNKRQLEDIHYENAGYRLYIPEGSIVGSYSLDLN